MKRRLLLISNSTCFGQGYLDHVASEIVAFLAKIKEVIFVPYALYDQDKYEAIASKRFAKMGFLLTSIHKANNPAKAVENAQAIFIGGGNTFRLLNKLYKVHTLAVIRRKVLHGMPYIGTSAGANIACPTIKTTNDMPIVYPPSFNALNLIPFQINVHYSDPIKNSTHMGETREQRIKEFLEENDLPIVGLREGTWLRIENNSVRLKGKLGARIFEQGKKPRKYLSRNPLDFLLKTR